MNPIEEAIRYAVSAARWRRAAMYEPAGLICHRMLVHADIRRLDQAEALTRACARVGMVFQVADVPAGGRL